MERKFHFLSSRFALLPPLALLVLPAHALNFSGTRLLLSCPERGNVEVLFHVYAHTQEKWKGNFETGSGHKTQGNFDIIHFANGDTLLHDRRNDSYSYAYSGKRSIVYCRKLEESSIHPTFG